MTDQTYPVSGGPGFVLNPAADFPNPPHPDRLPFMPIDPTDPSRNVLELSNPNEPGTPAAEAVQKSAEEYAELELNMATDETNLVAAGTLSASGGGSDPAGYASWGLRGGEFNPPGAMNFDDVKAKLKDTAQSRAVKPASARPTARPTATLGLAEETRSTVPARRTAPPSEKV